MDPTELLNAIEFNKKQKEYKKMYKKIKRKQGKSAAGSFEGTMAFALVAFRRRGGTDAELKGFYKEWEKRFFCP